MSRIKEPTEVEVKVDLSVKDLIAALRGLDDEDREFFIENLLAATSPEYLKSISQARKDYKEGKTIPFEKAFKK
jgi:hypothetical protein